MLGRLAATCRDWETSQHHFEIALHLTGSFGARPFLARTQCDYARMLLRRGEPAASRATGLLETATATARELSLPGLHASCEESAGGSRFVRQMRPYRPWPDQNDPRRSDPK